MSLTSPPRRNFLLATAAVAVAVAGRAGAALAAATKWPVPPQPPRRPTKVGNYGHQRIDDYAWLKPKNWQAVLRAPDTLDAPIKAAIAAETAYSDAMLAPSRPLQAQLRARAAALVEEPAPLEIEDGGYLYRRRQPPGGEFPVYERRRVGSDRVETLLDVGARAAGKPFFALEWGGARHSADHRLIGWSEDLTGSGIFAVKVKDIASGRMVVDDITQGHGGFAFDPRGRYLYWVGRNANGNPNAVWRRDIASGRDVKIHAEDDPAFFIELRTLASGAFVSIRMLNGAQSEVRLIPTDDPTATPIVVEPRAPDLRYSVEHWDDRLLILTDADGAADIKVMTTSVATPGRRHWQPFLPHTPSRYIAALHAFRGHLVREEWRDANPRLVVRDRAGRERDVAFEEAAYAIEVPTGQGWDAAALAFTFQSPRLPPRHQRLSLAGGTAAATGPAAAAPGFDPAAYTVTRIEAPTADGVRVPITLLRKAGAARDGAMPLFLYGYGSYGATVEPAFNPAAIALVDQGWTYAIAHVRGGAERGTGWWRSVLRTGKKKTFTDFIACAEHLIAQRYTAKRRIVAHGYSAGGLLMGAVYTMRPDLWAGVIAQVPFVDPINTMDDADTHPLGKTAIPIWGDPRNPAEHAYIMSYSPYDNLQPAAYPALLATGSVADERVSFVEPLKFAVKARALTRGHDPIMVRIATSGGHMGSSGTSAGQDQSAMFSAFAIWAADRRWGDVPQA